MQGRHQVVWASRKMSLFCDLAFCKIVFQLSVVKVIERVLAFFILLMASEDRAFSINTPGSFVIEAALVKSSWSLLLPWKTYTGYMSMARRGANFFPSSEPILMRMLMTCALKKSATLSSVNISLSILSVYELEFIPRTSTNTIFFWALAFCTASSKPMFSKCTDFWAFKAVEHNSRQKKIPEREKPLLNTSIFVWFLK